MENENNTLVWKFKRMLIHTELRPEKEQHDSAVMLNLARTFEILVKLQKDGLL